MGGAQYFDALGADFASGFSDAETAKSVQNAFAEFKKPYEQNHDSDVDDDRPLPRFVHLKQARLFQVGGNPLPGNKAIWWRGRISEVAGFMLGSLTAS